MLFAYTYVPHKMEKMQEFIDFIFTEVWCKAPIGLDFHPDLFTDSPDLNEIMSDFGFSAQAPERGKAFYKDIKAIYGLFASLSSEEISLFQQWYRGNNDIGKVCSNDPDFKLVRYADIPIAYKDLGDRLASFFKDLYSQSLLNLAALKAKIGSVADHYESFVRVNLEEICPFCGMSDMLGEYHEGKREAYDHYLPKGLYPFNSINFKNLVPACHHCNSTYKGAKDLAHSQLPEHDVLRRKFFYPYRTNAQKIEITVLLEHKNIDALRPVDINLEFGPAALAEELATWRDVYGIEGRYRAKLLGKNSGKYWITQAMDECKNVGKSPAEILLAAAKSADEFAFAECNFLKNAYLQGCHKAGIL